MSENKNDFTQGSIFSKLLRFMIPILGALILQAMYGAVEDREGGHGGKYSMSASAAAEFSSS